MSTAGWMPRARSRSSAIAACSSRRRCDEVATSSPLRAAAWPARATSTAPRAAAARRRAGRARAAGARRRGGDDARARVLQRAHRATSPGPGWRQQRPATPRAARRGRAPPAEEQPGRQRERRDQQPLPTVSTCRTDVEPPGIVQPQRHGQEPDRSPARQITTVTTRARAASAAAGRPGPSRSPGRRRGRGSGRAAWPTRRAVRVLDVDVEQPPQQPPLEARQPRHRNIRPTNSGMPMMNAPPTADAARREHAK